MNHFEKHYLEDSTGIFSDSGYYFFSSQVILFVNYQDLDMKRGYMLQVENNENFIYFPSFSTCSTRSIPWGFFEQMQHKNAENPSPSPS